MGQLSSLIAISKLIYNSNKDTRTLITNNAVFAVEMLDSNPLDITKGYNKERIIKQYLEYMQGRISLSNNLATRIPLSYAIKKYVDIGKYRIYLFVNDSEKRREKLLEPQKYSYEVGAFTKSMSAVIVVDRKEDKVAFSSIEKSSTYYIVYDSINHAVWTINKTNNSISIVIVHPDSIEVKKFYPHIMSIPQDFNGSLWNSEYNFTSNQYGIFIENRGIEEFLTVINGDITLLELPGKYMQKIKERREEGFFIKQVEPFIVSKENYMFYITMFKKNIHGISSVSKMTIKHNIDNYIGKDPIVSTALLDKKGSRQIFRLLRFNKKKKVNYTEIIYIDNGKGIVQVLSRDTTDVYACAHIDRKHFWVFTRKGEWEHTVENGKYESRYAYYVITNTICIYGMNAVHEVHKIKEKVVKSFANIPNVVLLPANEQDRRYIYFIDNVKRDNHTAITALDTETLQEQAYLLPSDYRLKDSDRLNIVRAGDEFLIGRWDNSDYSYKKDSDNIYRKTVNCFYVFDLVSGNKVYPFIDKYGRLTLAVDNPYAFINDYALDKSIQKRGYER